MRTLLRAILILIVLAVVVVAAATFFFGYRVGGGVPLINRDTTGTSGQIEPVRPLDQQDKDAGRFDTSKARERGAEIGQKVAEAGNKAAAFMSDAALTTKIKSKMSLDDHVKASDIHVSTDGHVVTLSGTVRSEDEHRRALDLARDTEGVKNVVDKIQISRQ